MQSHCVTYILIHILISFLAKSIETFNCESEYFSFLERNLTLKLKTATRLKHNLGKILYELPIENYELHHSIKIIENYLKNGGSLVECLDILPSITYVPIEEQIDGILGSMEDNLPKYLIPAISLIRRFMKEKVLDAEKIYRPTWGPPKTDPLEKISLVEAKEVALPLIYREPIKDIKGLWPKIIGETVSLINRNIISPRWELIAYVLVNLRIPDLTAEIRESIAHLFEYLQSNGERELTDLKTSFDPYELVAHAVSSLSLRNETLVAVNLLMPFLKKPSECWESSEFINLFHDDILNYTLLISRNRSFSKSDAAIALSSMIQKNNLDIQNTIEQFYPFEYVSRKDLLLAFVSQLKLQQIHRNGVSDNIVNNVYDDLVLANIQKQWQHLRNRDITGVILSAMARVENSIRIQRLLRDVATDKIVKPEIWQKAITFNLSGSDINGPMDATLKALKALLLSELLTSDVTKAKITELINVYENRINQTQIKCNSRLEILWSNFTQVGKEIEKRMKMEDIDIEDVLQALPGLNIHTNEYKSLKSFLSQSNLEAKIGQIDVNMHPTKGRLLAQLLEMMEIADIDNSLRHLAKRFIDNVAYDGYGAGALLYRSSVI